MEKTYNGWKNYATWNVMLWINNEEGLYRSSVRYADENSTVTYLGFIEYMGLEGLQTRDGVQWDDESLDYTALDKAIRENATV